MKIEQIAYNNAHVENWAANNQTKVAEASNLLDEDTKAVFIVGPGHSGKTTLSLFLSQQVAKNNPVKFIFTTPQIQETIGAIPVIDRSGAKYEKLPGVSEVANSRERHFIVIDEISTRGPTTLIWEQYIGLPNVLFLLLSHPERPATDKWRKLFPADKTKQYTL